MISDQHIAFGINKSSMTAIKNKSLNYYLHTKPNSLSLDKVHKISQLTSNNGKPLNSIFQKIISFKIEIYITFKKFFEENISIFFFRKLSTYFFSPLKDTENISIDSFNEINIYGYQRSGTGSLRELIYFTSNNKISAGGGYGTHSPYLCNFNLNNKLSKIILVIRNPIDCLNSLAIQRNIINDQYIAQKKIPPFFKNWINIEIIRWSNFWSLKEKVFWVPFLLVKKLSPQKCTTIIYQDKNNIRSPSLENSWEDIYRLNQSTKLKKNNRESNLPIKNKYKNSDYLIKYIDKEINKFIDISIVEKELNDRYKLLTKET